MAIYNKKELVGFAATETGLSKAKCGLVLDAILERAEDALSGGHEINVAGFGKLKVKEMAARTARNPRTGEKVQVAARKKVIFRPSNKLRRKLEQ
jgi:DNA-binding protein HU-beta